MVSWGFLFVTGDLIRLSERGKEILEEALPSRNPQDLLIQKNWDHFVTTVRRPIPRLPTELILLVVSHCETFLCLKAGRLMCRSWYEPMSEELYQCAMCKLTWSALPRLDGFDGTRQHNHFTRMEYLSVTFPLCICPIHNHPNLTFTRLVFLELSGFANFAETVDLTGRVRFENLSHLSLQHLSGPLPAWIQLIQGVNPRKLKKLTGDLCIVHSFKPEDFPPVAPSPFEFNDLVLTLNYAWGLFHVLQHFLTSGISSLAFTQNGVPGDEIITFLNRQAPSLKLLAWHAFIDNALKIEFSAMRELQHLSMHGTEFRPWVTLPVKLKAVSRLMAHTPEMTEYQFLDDALSSLVEWRPLQRLTIFPSCSLDVMELETSELEEFLPKTFHIGADKELFQFTSFLDAKTFPSAHAMRQANIIRKSLSTMESLGAVNFICSDETGTLTQNRMSAVNIGLQVPLQNLPIEQAMVEISKGDEEDIKALAAAAGLCNDAAFEGSNKESALETRNINGDATDSGLLRVSDYLSALQTNFVVKLFKWDTAKLPLPPSSREQFSHDILLLVKGAPDVLLPRCSYMLNPDGSMVSLSPSNISEIIAAQEEFASQGQRVLLIARRILPPGAITSVELVDLARIEDKIKTSTMELAIMGLVSLMDPLKEEAAETVRVELVFGFPWLQVISH
ncbi:hypothetical protein D9758_013990 [Tetrapyrgos nigripes]|uniref:F-box domain-containing protein n=1 Tax=Tetrapyrgos nigripes TaxID=182062 RepID=A0A8H5LJK5_9AGAR|nr:hypothetical protein D9758_013990 [Tetrapyrgos nigripes]